MDDIIELEQNVYLVHGKIIKAEKSGMFQGDKRADLIMLADGTLVEELKVAQHGPLTVFGIDMIDDATYGPGYVLDIHYSPRRLSDAAKEILRKEMPEYADEIG